TGRITDATQGTRHRTHCTTCRVAHCPDNPAEATSPATDATQCTGYRTDYTTKSAGRIADATQGTRHR
ncbi:hypothetical protein, partial [Burkholderia cenocepacia]|uniref:hypothetical protein n=1 Tax=Burkholderia cenocepacia TaxID=95486 RepID=UPI000B1F18E4